MDLGAILPQNLPLRRLHVREILLLKESPPSLLRRRVSQRDLDITVEDCFTVGRHWRGLVGRHERVHARACGGRLYIAGRRHLWTGGRIGGELRFRKQHWLWNDSRPRVSPRSGSSLTTSLPTLSLAAPRRLLSFQAAPPFTILRHVAILRSCFCGLQLLHHVVGHVPGTEAGHNRRGEHLLGNQLLRLRSRGFEGAGPSHSRRGGHLIGRE